MGADTLDGGQGNDRMDGGEDDDKLYGGEGVDHLKGNTGGDVIDGGEGNDHITDQSNDANDVSPNGIVGGDGDDTISVEGFGRFAIHGDDVLLGVTGSDQIYGGFLDDEIQGGPGNDELSGRSGGDDLLGGEGNDVLGRGHELDDAKDPGQDAFYGGEGNDFVLARDGENDRFIDCGEGPGDVAEVDHGLGEWQNTVNCETIWDGVGPSISAWGPTPSTSDPTPIIQANVRDSHPRMRIRESDVRLYVDGRVTASYDPLRGLVTYMPKRRLAAGKHTVKVEVGEAEGLKATKTWSFKVVRKR
jgi:Ca2+-binding RTX toxin-like protein